MSRLKLSWDSGFSSKIGTMPPSSGRLDTLQGVFFGGGGRGHVPPEKIRNLRSSNCWKCIEIVNLTITLLFLYHLKYFTISSGGPFWLLGGGCVRTPRTPPAYGPVLVKYRFTSALYQALASLRHLDHEYSTVHTAVATLYTLLASLHHLDYEYGNVTCQLAPFRLRVQHTVHTAVATL